MGCLQTKSPQQQLCLPTYTSLRVSSSNLVHGLTNSAICNTEVVKVSCIVMGFGSFVAVSTHSSLLVSSISGHCKAFDIYKTPICVIQFNSNFSSMPMPHKCFCSFRFL